MPTAVVGLLVLLVIAACEFSTAPPADLGESPTLAASEAATQSSEPTARPSSTSPEQFIAEAAAGSWRPAALPVSPGFLDRMEAACIAADPRLADVPVAVRELRGEGHVALIFGEASAAQPSWLCRGRLAATTAAELEVVTLEAPTAPIGDEQLDLVLYESLTDDEGDTRIVAAGRVGRLVDRVVAGFPDESEVEAARGGGWWAMWWPGSETTITIAALNRQSLAVDGLAPEGPPTQRRRGRGRMRSADGDREQECDRQRGSAEEPEELEAPTGRVVHRSPTPRRCAAPRATLGRAHRCRRGSSRR